MDVMKFLLNKSAEIGETKELQHIRWSKEAGEDVIFTIRTLDYDTLADLRERYGADMNAHVVLEGVVSPNFKDEQLRKKHGCELSVDVVKKILLPGEIDAISAQISILNGYGRGIVREVKKKSGPITKQT